MSNPSQMFVTSMLMLVIVGSPLALLSKVPKRMLWSVLLFTTVFIYLVSAASAVVQSLRN